MKTITSALFFLSICISPAAFADDNEKKSWAATNLPKNYLEECGTCHLAYPPGFMGKENWQGIMNNLSNHYGVDASLADNVAKDITLFLLQKAATTGRYAATSNDLRITSTRWWQKKHDEVSSKTFQRKSIGSPSNCAACHREAEKGIFDEDTVDIPK